MIIGWNKEEGLAFAAHLVRKPEDFITLKEDWDKNLATALFSRYSQCQSN